MTNVRLNISIKKSALTTAIITVAVAMIILVTTASAGASQTGVGGTAHDITSVGTPVCESCHVPHNASGEALWSMTPKAGMSGQQALCFSCHDGTVSDLGTYISNMTYYTHVVSPDGNLSCSNCHDVHGGPENKKGLNSSSAHSVNQDCDRCHNPHNNSWKFIQDELLQNADICISCHTNYSNNHPVDMASDSYEPTDRIWDPYNETPDLNGTRLWDTAGTTVVATGSGDIKCMTCHATHGAVSQSLNSIEYKDPESTSSPLCSNCH